MVPLLLRTGVVKSMVGASKTAELIIVIEPVTADVNESGVEEVIEPSTMLAELPVTEKGTPLPVIAPERVDTATFTALVPPLNTSVSVARMSPVPDVPVMAPAVPALNVTSPPAPEAESTEPAPRVRANALPAPLLCIARLLVVASTVPSLTSVGVVRVTEVPLAVTPALTVMASAAVLPDVADRVVPALVSALRVTSALALKPMEPVALVAPPTVSEPPFALTVRAPVELTVPVFTFPAAVVMEIGLPVAVIVPVIELTDTATLLVPPLKLTLSTAEMSPSPEPAVMEPAEVALNVTSEPAPAAESSDPAPAFSVSAVVAPLL